MNYEPSLISNANQSKNPFGLIAAVTSGQAQARESLSRAWAVIESGDADYNAICEWAIAQAVIERLNEASVGLQRSRYHDDPEKQVLAANPNCKQILLRVIELRLAIARDELERVKAVEQTRLDQEHGVGEYDAADSQPVKRVARSVERLQKVQQRITDEPIETTWPLFAKEMSEL